jgi:NAD(P)-dependent dehydrogenase (short-subunit alcohol dehydrogenase family)
MRLRLSGKKVFVTGASRGIGRAIARAMRSEGAWVIGTRTRPLDDADEVCQEWVQANFTNSEQLTACIERVRDAKPDVLINNAGINKVAAFVDIAAEDFLEIQRVNVLAPLLLCQAAIPAMKERGWGRIVNVSSIFGKISKAQRASYSASKFALDGLTVALAAEHSADGILANSIAPGFIDTELTRRVLGEAGLSSIVSGVPIGRLGQGEEIARLVIWLASNDNTFVTGQNIAIDGGFSRV